MHSRSTGVSRVQPLAMPCIVATMRKIEVYAIDARSGTLIWRRAPGEPVVRFEPHCSNISPLGVTGTPVIDEDSATIYLDAAVMRSNGQRHEIYALSLADGSIEPGWPLDVATALDGSFAPSLQNQRGALALFAKRIFVPFGANWGDCGAYHGFIIAASTNEATSIRAFRRALKVVAFGRKAASLAMESHSSQRPVILLARTHGAMGRPSCASVRT